MSKIVKVSPLTGLLRSTWYPQFTPDRGLAKITMAGWKVATMGATSEIILIRNTDKKTHSTTLKQFYMDFLPELDTVHRMFHIGYQLDSTQNLKNELVFVACKSRP